MDSPESWRWVWLVATFVFAVGEMGTPGAFFLGPFAVGAAVATVLAFLGVAVGIEWVAFVGISGAAFLALRPLARRLDQIEPAQGIGAKRLIGETGTVLTAIPGGTSELGLVRVGREEWRAESLDGSAVSEGTPITVLEVRGTRVVVWPSDRPSPMPPTSKELP